MEQNKQEEQEENTPGPTPIEVNPSFLSYPLDAPNIKNKKRKIVNLHTSQHQLYLDVSHAVHGNREINFSLSEESRD